MSFQFMNITHPSESQAPGSKRRVRSHVTSQYHRQHVGAGSGKPRGKRQPKELGRFVGAFRGVYHEPQRKESRQEWKYYEPHVRKEKKEARADEWVGRTEDVAVVDETGSLCKQLSSRVDPFQCLPMTLNQEGDLLLNRYISLLIPSRAPLGFKAKWLMESLHSELLLHGLLIVSSGYYSLLQDKPESRATMQRRCNVIKRVTSALDNPATALNDEIIGVVTCLAFAEFLLNRRKPLEMHMRGLKKMVDLRGGLDTLGIAGLLKTFILLVDLCTSTVPGLRGHFEEHQLPPEDSHYVEPHPTVRINPQSTPPVDPTLSTHTLQTSQRITHVKANPYIILSQTLSLIYSTNNYIHLIHDTASQHRPSYHFLSGVKLYNLEHPALVLCSLLSPDPSATSSVSSRSSSPISSSSIGYDQSTTLAHALLTTLLLYIHSYIRGFPPHAPIVRRWITQLIDILSEADRTGDLRRWSKRRVELVVWILVLGRARVCDSSDQERFNRWLNLALEDMNMGWKEAEEMLKECKWLPIKMKFIWMEGNDEEENRYARLSVVPYSDELGSEL